ncbi:uncharacterized protein LOC131931476 [Physella acuta]|uniref:uncharacterized protein LOC131931476 n=1 Tax=Physella acuta TaxID=109671 RepID=UPI0027DCE178|nr:uncharacterized protein LOC131931476 [Physella acuta]
MAEEDKTGDVILKQETRMIIEIVNVVFLYFFFSVFGIVTNVINMIIFYKQGLKSAMNICLFALAATDILNFVYLLECSFFLNPLVEYSGVRVNMRHLVYVAAGWPHVVCTRIAYLIMAYVTAERCISVALPLKVKAIVTPRRTKIAICLMLVFSAVMVMPEYASVYLDWQLILPRNESVLTLQFASNRICVSKSIILILSEPIALL